MEEGTFLVHALTELGEEVAFGHFVHVVFVKKFAVIAFLAETAKPMFADHCFITMNVAKWTTLVGTFGTQEELANANIRFVHVGEGKWQRSLLRIDDLVQIKGNALHRCNNVLHQHLACVCNRIS